MYIFFSYNGLRNIKIVSVAGCLYKFINLRLTCPEAINNILDYVYHPSCLNYGPGFLRLRSKMFWADISTGRVVPHSFSPQRNLSTTQMLKFGKTNSWNKHRIFAGILFCGIGPLFYMHYFHSNSYSPFFQPLVNGCFVLSQGLSNRNSGKPSLDNKVCVTADDNWSDKSSFCSSKNFVNEKSKNI